MARTTTSSVAIGFGVGYFLIAWVSTLPASQPVARLTAWIFCGILYVAHIWYERFVLRSSPRPAAIRVAAAAALGALGLALAGMLHSLTTTGAARPSWLLALVLWPAFTAIPALAGAALIFIIFRRLT